MCFEQRSPTLPQFEYDRNKRICNSLSALFSKTGKINDKAVSTESKNAMFVKLSEPVFSMWRRLCKDLK